MDNKQFKQQFKSASCTNRPWQYLIPKSIRKEVLSKVKKECLEIYGRDFSECSKRLTCFNKICTGRELEWKSPTALPYLKKFAKLVNIKENSNYFIKTDCKSCPIYNSCSSICAQINDFTSRDKVEEISLQYKEDLDNLMPEPNREFVRSFLLKKSLNIPWDALNSKRRSIIEKYLYEQKDFLTIANELNLYDQAQTKYEFYAGLTTLSKYATMRLFIEKNNNILSIKEKTILTMIYNANLTISQVAHIQELSKQAIQQTISRIIKNNNLKWNIFVKKKNGKIIYNIPRLLK